MTTIWLRIGSTARASGGARAGPSVLVHRTTRRAKTSPAVVLTRQPPSAGVRPMACVASCRVTPKALGRIGEAAAQGQRIEVKAVAVEDAAAIAARTIALAQPLAGPDLELCTQGLERGRRPRQLLGTMPPGGLDHALGQAAGDGMALDPFSQQRHPVEAQPIERVGGRRTGPWRR